MSTQRGRASELYSQTVPSPAGKERWTTDGMLCLEHCSISSSLLSFGSVSTRATDEPPMVFVGIDWAEAHHDICVVDEEGQVLAKRRAPEGLEGVGKLDALGGLLNEYSRAPIAA